MFAENADQRDRPGKLSMELKNALEKSLSKKSHMSLLTKISTVKKSKSEVGNGPPGGPIQSIILTTEITSEQATEILPNRSLPIRTAKTTRLRQAAYSSTINLPRAQRPVCEAVLPC